MEGVLKEHLHSETYKGTGGDIKTLRAWENYGAWDGHIHTAILKMDNQQGLAVHHRDHCSMSCGRLDGRGF